METLRLLANSYKHDPSPEPGDGLLRHLGLSMDVNYADLPNSKALQKGLAASLDLQDDVDYCDISDELLNRANRFLAEVKEQLEKKGMLSPIKPQCRSLRVVAAPRPAVCWRPFGAFWWGA